MSHNPPPFSSLKLSSHRDAVLPGPRHSLLWFSRIMILLQKWKGGIFHSNQEGHMTPDPF